MDQILKTEIEQMKGNIQETHRKMDKMYTAILGSEITKDGGLVGRILDLEKEISELRKEIELMKTARAKTELYVKIMWGMVGAFGSGIFLYVLNLIFKK